MITRLVRSVVGTVGAAFDRRLQQRQAAHAPRPSVEHPALLLGIGMLDWPRAERVTDRYGLIGLWPRPDSAQPRQLLAFPKPSEVGELRAIITEIRPSRFQWYWEEEGEDAPQVGTEVILGCGWFWRSGRYVGVKPTIARTGPWLDLGALYQTHSQTVALWFVPTAPGPEQSAKG